MHKSRSPNVELSQVYNQTRYLPIPPKLGPQTTPGYQFDTQRFLANSRVEYPPYKEQPKKILRQTLGFQRLDEFGIRTKREQKLALRKPSGNDFRSELDIGMTVKEPKPRNIYTTTTEASQNGNSVKLYGYERTIDYEPMKESRSTKNLGEKKYEYLRLEQKYEENNKRIQRLTKIVELDKPNYRKTSDTYEDQSQQSFANFKKKKYTEDRASTYVTPKANKNVYSPKQESKFSPLTTAKVGNKLEDFGFNSSILPPRKNQSLSNGYSKQSLKVSIRDFQIGISLGEGKFGKVYKAYHPKTGSIYAVKRISKNLITSHLMIPQLTLELRLQSCLNHKHILQMHGFFHDSTQLYIVLEYMEGGTLYSKLKKATRLKESEAAEVVQQITSAVEFLHDLGIAHRDIKPENIVISSNVCKLCDFGWATFCDQERRKTYCGTFDYAAPQILQGVEYDMSVDLWCLGILTYELLTGKAPFYHISRKQTMKRIMNVENSIISYPSYLSTDAVDFIQQLIRKNPDERLKASKALQHPFLKQVEPL